MSSNYATCLAENGGEADSTLECVATKLESQILAGSSKDADFQTWLFIVVGAMVLFMQAGFAMICAGTVRRKNVSNTLMKNLLDACGAFIAYYVCGFAFSFGAIDEKLSFIGNANFFLLGDFDRAFFFFQSAMSANAVTIVASTLAERCRMISYLCFSLFLSGFIYPVVVHFIWSGNGYLSSSVAEPLFGVGVIDFAGSGVVHMTGGMAAVCASCIIGPRRGRFRDDEKGLQKTQSVPLLILGTMILWFGWYGFNPGSALLLGVPNSGQIAAIAAVNTSLAGASGAITALLTNAFYLKQTTGEFSLEIGAAMNGCLTGLVAITGSCAVVKEGWALLIGIIAAWVYLGSSMLLLRWKIDDAVDSIPVHLFGGLWGLVATGLFAHPQLLADAFGTEGGYGGWFYNLGHPSLLIAQLIGAAFILSWTGLGMIPFFKFLDYIGALRVNELDEIIGLDATYGGEEVPLKLFDEQSSEFDEGLRLQAYQLQFEGKRKKKAANMDDLAKRMNDWGNPDNFKSSRNKNMLNT